MLGGSAVHFSMAARLFTSVNLVAVVGDDFPRKHISFLREKGIVLSALTTVRGRTFKWEGEYRGDLNTALTLNTELGVLTAFRPRIAEEQKKIKHIFLANVDPEIQEHLLDSMQAPELVGLDSMNFWIRHKKKTLLSLLRRVTIFVCNDQEARDLSGEHNLISAARFLNKRGARMVIIKKGEHGVLFYCPQFIFMLPAYPTDRVIDPTGAGDTFAGGFMGYLSKVRKADSAAVRQALAYGTVAASFNVEGFGSEKTSRLTRARLNGRLRKFRSCLVF